MEIKMIKLMEKQAPDEFFIFFMFPMGKLTQLWTGYLSEGGGRMPTLKFLHLIFSSLSY